MRTTNPPWLAVLAALFMICFLTFRPFQLQLFGMMYSGDDASYFAYGSSLAYLEFPSLEKEFFTEAKAPPTSRLGPGLMAAPWIGLFSIVDRIQGSSIVEKRTEANVLPSWSLFGAMVSAYFYLIMACLLLFKIVESRFNGKIAALTVIALVLLEGTPLYAFRRPVFSHVYELFLQSLFLFFSYRLHLNRDAFQSRVPARYWFGLGTALALMILVRQNGLPYALFWPIWICAFMAEKPLEGFKKNARALILTLALGIAAAIVLKRIPAWSNPEMFEQARAQQAGLGFLLDPIAWGRFIDIFVGLDWGLAFTAPFILLGIFGIWKLPSPEKSRFALLALPLVINLYLLLIWSGQGSWYGFRYFIFSAIPVVLLPLASLISQGWSNPRIRWALILIAFFPTASMLAFEGNDTTLTLFLNKSRFNETYVSNPIFQIQVWKSIFIHPTEFLYAVIKAGPCYLIYLGATLLGKSALLPAKFAKVYSEFRWDILIKTAVIYCMPWLFTRAAAKICLLSCSATERTRLNSSSHS